MTIKALTTGVYLFVILFLILVSLISASDGDFPTTITAIVVGLLVSILLTRKVYPSRRNAT